MNVEQFKETVGQLMKGGDLKLAIEKKKDGFQVKVIEYELMDHIDWDTGEPTGETEEFNSIILTLYTDGDNKISFIEHPYGAFTRVNAQEVTFVVSMVGLTIEGLSEDLSDY